MSISVDDVAMPGFRTATAVADGAVQVRFIGTADSSVVEPTDAFLKAVHTQAVAAKVPRVVIDMQDLEFITSSCLAKLIAWVAEVEGTPEAYKIHFRIASRMRWQERSVKAIVAVAPGVVVIESPDSP